ncbi:MAG TPA: ChaN family lipoprotein [Fimbriimonadaceae bacterium]|jgi:uncharacterized iron-regulated protein
MVAISLLLGFAFLQKDVDPLRLPIGPKGEITLQPGEIVDTRTGAKATIADIVGAADGKGFVFLGESHTNPEHHKFQARVIESLAAKRPVVVGFEMFTRPVQDELNPWTMGWYTQDEFIEKSDWKHQWGYDFNLYKPIFDVTRDQHIPMVALNIPRPWVHMVGTQGYGGLTADQKAQLPTDLGALNPVHREVFNAMIGGGHPGSTTSLGHMYEAQVLWDQAMADSALKYEMAHPQPSDGVFVVVAGSGHVMYRQGINYRIWKRTGQSGVTVVMVDEDGPVTVSKGLGDFVYCAGRETKQ